MCVVLYTQYMGWESIHHFAILPSQTSPQVCSFSRGCVVILLNFLDSVSLWKDYFLFTLLACLAPQHDCNWAHCLTLCHCVLLELEYHMADEACMISSVCLCSTGQLWPAPALIRIATLTCLWWSSGAPVVSELWPAFSCGSNGTLTIHETWLAKQCLSLKLVENL